MSPWIRRIVLWYLPSWAAGMTIAAITMNSYLAEQYRRTFAQAWELTLVRSDRLVFLGLLMGVAHLAGLIGCAAAMRVLRPGTHGLLRYLCISATVCYLLWTLTLPLGLWAIFTGMFFAGLFAVLAVPGALAFGMRQLADREQPQPPDRGQPPAGG